MSDHTLRLCATCGTEFVPLNHRQKLCDRRCRRKGEADCEWCGAHFQRNNAGQACCSKRCARSLIRPKSCVIPWASCLACQQWFMARGNRICPCRPRGKKPKPPIEGNCALCGAAFTAPPKGARRLYCSKRCTDKLKAERTRNSPTYRADKRRAKQRRRARLRGATVERFDDTDVFKRDNWRCGICGRKTLRTAKVPNPRAPTIDHLIPLAQGGDHVLANVQCACFLCNSIKCDGTTDRGDQLRLIG